MSPVGIAPQPAELPVARRDLLTALFGRTIVDADIFAQAELPHGATPLDGKVYFVLYAPHAVTLSLILISGAGIRTSVAMQPTPDARYWWCSVMAAQVPKGQRYRFRQNDDIEILDPASRWVTNPSNELWAQLDEGIDRAWSLYLDPADIRSCLHDDGWRTRTWESMIVYQLHPLRFTVRNPCTDGFDQVAAELAAGHYLDRFGATELEFLPIHEFQEGDWWGYGSVSLYAAIHSGYGGPEALARCVAAAHRAGKGVMMDLVFNHVGDSPLQAIARDVYVDGSTFFGDEINYDHPMCREYFRQVMVYLWSAFRIDGFRFDCTEAIVNGQWPKDGVIREGGSGGGWEFLQMLRDAVRRAADATEQPWPICVGENNPCNWGMTNNSNGGVLDGQWHFPFHYSVADLAKTWDKTQDLWDAMNVPHTWRRPFSEAVRFAESHDSCGHPDSGEVRIVRQAPLGLGFQMAKATGTVALLAMGVPMLFMGSEGGEDNDFFPAYNRADDRNRAEFFARLATYESLGDDRNRVLAWFRDLIGLRNNANNGLQGNDSQVVGRGNSTIAFARAGGRFFVIATFGTPDQRQNLGWLGLPAGAAYKEIFNSSWPAYEVVREPERSNGSYWAVLDRDSIVNLPPVGAIVLERR